MQLMKHMIIVKFLPGFDWTAALGDIKAIFDPAVEIEGVTEVEYLVSNSDRANRSHLIICITCTAEGLKSYDVSALHKKWKAEYTQFIESKAIFDCDC